LSLPKREEPFVAERRRNPEATRNAILDAAEALFVKKGFAAASMSAVAQQAGVTKSLIHHHFGSKEELWIEVKRRRIADYASQQRQIMAEGIDVSSLGRSLESYFRYLQRNPSWVRLNAWMSLEDPRLSDLVNPDLMASGVAGIRRSQERGSIRSDVDARHILAQFISLCLNYFLAKQSYIRAKLVADDDASDDAYLQDLLKIFLSGLEPRGGTASPKPRA
jgi:TetR/AcrR family transcriptional regulator